MSKIAFSTFKYHIIADLVSINKYFPIYLWNGLIYQDTSIINLLHQPCINPNLSAYERMEGYFDYNKMPLAAPGIIVIASEKAAQRKN